MISVTLTVEPARGIVLREASIPLLFTERYNGFSFRGGGVEDNEEMIDGLCRELEEEAGARNVRVQYNYGYVEELRPHRRDGFDLMHMTSHFFVCDIDPDQAAPKMEHYETANGMRPVWINLHKAIAHNRGVMRRSETTMGLTILRETFMLEKVAASLDCSPVAVG